MIAIHRVTDPSDVEEIKRLFLCYQADLGVDLCFQSFDEELATLPGNYAPPGGALLIAKDEAGTSLGCIALRPTNEPARGEIKRLYVTPEARGKGLGRKLVEAVLQSAKSAGYNRVCLDTLPSMPEAIGLYRSFGFTEIDPYYTTPLEETLFLGRQV